MGSSLKRTIEMMCGDRLYGHTSIPGAAVELFTSVRDWGMQKCMNTSIRKNCQLHHKGVESEEHHVCHCIIFYAIEGIYYCIFKQGFGPLYKVKDHCWCFPCFGDLSILDWPMLETFRNYIVTVPSSKFTILFKRMV